MSETDREAVKIYVMACISLSDAYEEILEASSAVLTSLQEVLEVPPKETTDVELNQLLLDAVRTLLKRRKESP